MAAAVLGLALSMVALFSCGDPLDPQQEVSRLEAVSGSGQEGAVATTLPDSLVVLALAENGEPVSGATVSWTVSAGALDRGTTRTDSLGRAATRWTLGETAGRQTAVATAEGEVSVEFVIRAHPAAPTSLVVEPAELRLDALAASERLHVTATDAYGRFLSGRQGAFARALGPDLTIINHDSWPRLMDLWGASNSEIFGVGSDGAILHYDGAGWSEMESGTTSDLSAVWGTGPEMVLAAGASGTLIRFDGASWEELPSPGGGDITALWGLAQDDFFAAFQSGPIARYDGTEWRTTAVVPPEGIDAPSEIGAMYGFGPQTVFAVGWTEGSGGEQPALMRYEGTAWDVFVHSGYGRLHDVWGSSPADMYAVGEDRGDNGRPLLLHFDGVELTSVDLPVDSDSWYHPLEAVWGTGPSDVYAAGEDGLMLHYDGTEWTVLPSVTTRRVSSLWGTATGPVWAVARGVGGTGSLLVGRSP